MQKENYRQEKKRATKQLLSALTDPRVVIMADSLKVGVTGMRVHAAHSGGPRRGLAKSPAAQQTGQRTCYGKSGPLRWGCPDEPPRASSFKPEEFILSQAGGQSPELRRRRGHAPKTPGEDPACLSQFLGLPGSWAWAAPSTLCLHLYRPLPLPLRLVPSRDESWVGARPTPCSHICTDPVSH